MKNKKHKTRLEKTGLGGTELKFGVNYVIFF